MKAVIELQERKRGVRCCSNAEPRLTAEAAQQVSDDLQILAHPIRLQILDLLAQSEGQVCVCDLEAAVSVKQPTVSHHLRLLRDAGPHRLREARPLGLLLRAPRRRGRAAGARGRAACAFA